MEQYGNPYPPPSEITFRVANGLRLAAKVWGQPLVRTSLQSVEAGDVRIIAGHGFLDNAGSWDPAIPHFLKIFTAAVPHLSVTIVAVDWLGHGLSDHRDRQSDYSPWRHVDDLRYVMEELGWKRCVLWGHSMGGGIVSQFAGTFPDMVSHLVMVDNFGPWGRPGAHAPEDLIMHLKKTRALARKTKPTYPTIEAATKARMNGQNPVSETAAAPLVLRGLMELETSSELSFDSSLDDDGDEPAGETAVNKLWTWRTDQRLTLGPSSHYNEEACRAYLGRIKCPTLAILAKTGHWTRNLKPMLDSRIDLVRKATGDLVIEIVDSTHHLHMEDPVTTARLLVEFMKTRLDVLDRPKKKVQAQAARL